LALPSKCSLIRPILKDRQIHQELEEEEENFPQKKITYFPEGLLHFSASNALIKPSTTNSLSPEYTTLSRSV
jgi:hypothetical protein